jgi:hypothetical protein
MARRVSIQKDEYDIAIFNLDLSEWLLPNEYVEETTIPSSDGSLVIYNQQIVDNTGLSLYLEAGLFAERLYQVPLRWITNLGRRRQFTLTVVMRPG